MKLVNLIANVAIKLKDPAGSTTAGSISVKDKSTLANTARVRLPASRPSVRQPSPTPTTPQPVPPPTQTGLPVVKQPTGTTEPPPQPGPPAIKHPIPPVDPLDEISLKKGAEIAIQNAFDAELKKRKDIVDRLRADLRS